jgi:dipeptide transport system permease protein
MFKYLLKKLYFTIPTLIGVSLLAFLLIRLVPGDPVRILLGERGGSAQQIEDIRTRLGLDQPLPMQYLKFVGNSLAGDLGVSIVTKRTVVSEFFTRFPATLELGVVALLFSIIVGIPLGILAAVKRNSWLDYTVMGTSLVGYSMPIFWWGLILILIFSVTLGLTPVSGRISIMYDIPEVSGFMMIDTLMSSYGFAAFWDAFLHLILPAIAMGTIPLAVIARMTRSSMLEVLGEDYVRTAKAKGLSTFEVIGIHALRNALIPVVTVIGLMFGSIITGAILTETIFSWPGIGRWLVKSVEARDYPVIQGGTLIIAVMVVLTNMAVDLLYAVVNPRIREDS